MPPIPIVQQTATQSVGFGSISSAYPQLFRRRVAVVRPHGSISMMRQIDREIY